LVAFWGLLGAFTVAYNIKVLVSGYQSIEMYLIVLPVKFEGGLPSSVLRNKQLYQKKGSKSTFLKKFENVFLRITPLGGVMSLLNEMSSNLNCMLRTAVRACTYH
jgi:hypothetical protein